MDSNPNDPTYNPPQPDVIPPVPAAQTSGLSDNTAAALAYVTIIPAIIFLVLEPYNRIPFIRFNALQCICLGVTVFACQIILSFIPIVGWILLIPLWICAVIAWVLCVTKALKGEWFKLPVLGDFAMKQAKI